MEKVTEALDEVAPLKPISVWLVKPDLSLKENNLAAISSRDAAQKNGNQQQHKKLQNLCKSLVEYEKI